MDNWTWKCMEPGQSAYHVFPRKSRCGARPIARQRARRQAMARTDELRDGLGLLVSRFRRPHLSILSPCGVGATAASASSREKKLKGAHRSAASLWPKCPVGCFRFRVVVTKSVETSAPPPGGRRPPPEGGAHLGHVFRGQRATRLGFVRQAARVRACIGMVRSPKANFPISVSD